MATISPEVLDVRPLAADEAASKLDALERQAAAEGLLVRQRPTEAGVYEVSDGRAFRALPVVLTAEGLERRRLMHARAGQA